MINGDYTIPDTRTGRVSQDICYPHGRVSANGCRQHAANRQLGRVALIKQDAGDTRHIADPRSI